MVSHDLQWVMQGFYAPCVCLNKHICCSGLPESIQQHPEYQAIFWYATHVLPASSQPLGHSDHVEPCSHDPALISPRTKGLSHDGMVTTTITRLDHGHIVGIFNCATGLSMLWRRMSFLQTPWRMAHCLVSRLQVFCIYLLAGCWLSGGIAGCHSMGFARLVYRTMPCSPCFSNPALSRPVINPASPELTSRTVKLSVW